MRKKIKILIILLSIGFSLSLAWSSPVLAEEEKPLEEEKQLICKWKYEESSVSNSGVTTIKNEACKFSELYNDSQCRNAGLEKPMEFQDNTSWFAKTFFGGSKYSIPRCCCTEAQELTGSVPWPTVPFTPQVDLGIKFEAPQIYVTTDGKMSYEVNWLGLYLGGVYDIALKFGAIIATIVLMAGGLLWLVSGGNTSKTSQAKTIILNSIIGLVLLFSSYLILNTINPDLTNLKPIRVGSVGDYTGNNMKNKNSALADYYKNMQCATDTELENGVEFFATGYCKPEWEDSKKFRCMIAMNCSCPNGRDTSQNCDEFFSTEPGYAPCKKFDKDVEYCNKTSSGTAPYEGSIAGPRNCIGGLNGAPIKALNYYDQVCFNGKTYTITDTGSDKVMIGRRIDIWTGSDCNKAMKVTGVGKLTLGPCKNEE